jgi:hypothetical protein
MPASNQARQGGDGKTFEAGANAADYLYTTDTATIHLKILGDPAWIPSPANIQPGQFVTAPFFPDGTINTTASAAYFEFAWNKPTDYDPDTGLMDPGQNNFGADRANGKAGLAQTAVSYQATTVKSVFRGGKFTQELDGTWLQSPIKKAAADSGRKTDPAPVVVPGPPPLVTPPPVRIGPSPTTIIPPPVRQRSSSRGAGPAYDTTGVDQPAALAPLPANSISSINTAELRPATFPDQELALQPPVEVVAPPKLPRGGFGSGANNPSVNSNIPVVSPNPPQGIVNDDQGWSI